VQAFSVQNFPLARLHFVATADHDLQLPRFTGSMLRGAFGHALKNLVCVTGLDDCRQCPLYRSCAYPAVFQPPPPAHAGRGHAQIPVPYVVEPPPFDHSGRYGAGKEFCFSMVLIGPALDHQNLIISAWRRALATGLGPGRARLTLQRVVDEGGNLVYSRQGGATRHQPVRYEFVPQSRPVSQLTFEFVTPLNLRSRGRELDCDSVNPYILLMALARRTTNFTTLLLGCKLLPDYSRLAQQAQKAEGHKQLVWKIWRRKSSRQKQSMPIGGVIGRWHLKGPLDDFWPFIHLGQWLHVGKKCSFGLGRYIINREAT